MSALIAPAVFILLWIILCLYFFFTVVAIRNGAAPIPSLRSTVRGMLEQANLKPGDLLIDLGSGDGRILFGAARRGARSIGYEINPFLYWYTRCFAWLTGLRSVTIHRSDFWKADISQADVLTIYLVPSFMPRLKEKVLREMKPGSKVIAGVYPMPDWTPSFAQGWVYVYEIPERPSITQ